MPEGKKSKRKTLADTLKEQSEDKEGALQETANIVHRIRQRPTEQATEQPIEQATEQSTEQPRTTYRTIEQTSEQTTEQPIEQATEQPNNLLSEQSTEQPIEQATEHPIYINTPDLSHRQKELLLWIVKNNIFKASMRELNRAMGYSYSSIRRSLSRLEKQEYLTIKTIWDGPYTTKKFILNKNRFKEASEQPTEQPIEQSTERITDRTTGSKKIDRKNSVYLSNQGGGVEGGEKSEKENTESKLKSLSDSDIEFYWPNLMRHGFGTNQIHQIIERLKKVEKALNYIFRSLDYAEWELEHGKMTDKNGESVRDPNSFVFSSLAKHGYYRRPPDYISPEEQAEEDARKEAERIKKAREKREQEEFEAWKKSLSDETYQEIMKHKKGPEEPFLKNYWKTKIKENKSTSRLYL